MGDIIDLKAELAKIEQEANDASKWEHLSTENARVAARRTMETNKAKTVLRKISPDPKWHLAQVVMQEVISQFVVEDPNRKVPVCQRFVDDYVRLVEDRYANDAEKKKLLLMCTPTLATLAQWTKKPGWEEAVWDRIRDTGLFTKERRAAMIDALYKRGMDKDTQAAKIWLTLSGDYSEKMDVKTDATVDKFREINEILHGKKA